MARITEPRPAARAGAMIRGLLLASLVLLAACATSPSRVVLDARQQQARLLGLQNWSLQGRVAVRTASDGVQADIRWRQRGAASDVRLAGPFGAGTLQLHLENGRLRVTDSHGTVLEDAEAADALRRQLGFDPPLGALRYWLLGLAMDGEPVAQVPGPDGLTTQLTQREWLVRYEDFRPQRAGGETVSLARRLTATRADLRLRLVVDRWRLE